MNEDHIERELSTWTPLGDGTRLASSARRERIATAALQGFLAGGIGAVIDRAQIVAKSVGIADALIAELDRKGEEG